MSRVVTATYRLQLHRGFPLSAARERVSYLHRLGVSHLYLSPILAACPGSTHGYDVVDPSRINPELGNEDDLRGLADDLHARGMGIILDVVPNHMAASEHNPYWDNVLERGRESRFAEWFDIDWAAPRAGNRVVLPVLGDEIEHVLARGELQLRIRDSGSRIAYFDRTFPLDPATLPREVQLAQWDPSGRPAADEWVAGDEGRSRLRALLEAQHYKLVFWRRANDINYRRFFDVSDLVSVRMETDAVFDATHRLVLSWVRDGVLDGLRIDHVDGLRSPGWYLARLRAEVDALRHQDAPDRFPLWVEKILGGEERLPDWPVEGTTGYDFMTDVEDLFLDPAGFGALEAAYRALRHNPGLRFAAIATEGKRRALTGPLWPDVMRAARLAQSWRFSASTREIADAIVELIVHLPVYRTYVDEPGIVRDADRRFLTTAFEAARRAERVNAEALRLLRDAFFAKPSAADAVRATLVTRIQQVSAPATAKGIEDTALYVYLPLVSRNEVGGEPDRPLDGAHGRVHARHAERASNWPRCLLATDTHDTKRSGDVRARLGVLTALPQEWTRHVTRWRRLNKPRRRVVRGKLTPDTNSEYLFYQTLFGIWPAARPERRADDIPGSDWLDAAKKRLVPYMLKAAREAKTRTSWTESDPEYEQALLAFVEETLTPSQDAQFLPDLARLTALAANRAFGVSLGRLIIQCISPGVPDIYQGSEFWSFTLVDPDNRRPVDFAERERALAALEAPGALTKALSTDRRFESRTKIAFVARLLRFRRDHPQLCSEGDYFPLRASEAADRTVFAFARRWQDQQCIAVVRTSLEDPPAASSKGTIDLPPEYAGLWTSVITDNTVRLALPGVTPRIPMDELAPRGHACDLLFRVTGMRPSA